MVYMLGLTYWARVLAHTPTHEGQCRILIRWLNSLFSISLSFWVWTEELYFQVTNDALESNPLIVNSIESIEFVAGIKYLISGHLVFISETGLIFVLLYMFLKSTLGNIIIFLC